MYIYIYTHTHIYSSGIDAPRASTFASRLPRCHTPLPASSSSRHFPPSFPGRADGACAYTRKECQKPTFPAIFPRAARPREGDAWL